MMSSWSKRRFVGSRTGVELADTTGSRGALVGKSPRAADRDGTAVSGHVLNKTTDFLTTLPAEFPPPVVVVESEDEIGLDWDEGAERVVSLTIDDSDRIGFAALFGREPLYGKAEFSDGLPEMVRYLLGRLYPSARRAGR